MKHRLKVDRERYIAILIVMGLAAFLRFWGLAGQGIEDIDGATHYFLALERLPKHDLSPMGHVAAGYLWGRHSYVAAMYFESLLVHLSAYAVLLHNALCGVFAVGLLLWAGERFLARHVGVFAALVLAVAYMPVMYSRHMKDFGHTFFFLLLGVVLLLWAWRQRRPLWYLLAGLVLGVGATGNYASAPVVLMVVLTQMAVALWDGVRRNESWRGIGAAALSFWAGLAVLPVVFEVFHTAITHHFLFWKSQPGVSYITGFLMHMNAASTGQVDYRQSLGITFYLRIFWQEGPWFALAAGLGLVLSALFRRYRNRTTLLFALILMGPILLYGLDREVADFERNIWPSYMGFAMFAGIGLREIVAGLAWLFTRRADPARRRPLTVAVAVAVLAAASIPRAIPAIGERSAAEVLHRFIKVDRACYTHTQNFTYHWEWWYFRDPRLACKTWDDVVQRYMRDRAEYLAILPQGYVSWETSELAAYEGEPALVAQDYHGRSVWHDPLGEARLYDLRDPGLQRDRLGLEPLPALEAPDRVQPGMPSDADLRRALWNDATTFDASLPVDSGYLEVRGRVELDRPGELLLLAVGSPENPVQYYLEALPARLPSLPLGGRRAVTSLQTFFLVEGVERVRVSLLYVPSPYASSTSSSLSAPDVHDFALVPYARASGLPTPRFAIAPDVDLWAYHAQVLRRMSVRRARYLSGPLLQRPGWRSPSGPNVAYVTRGSKDKPLLNQSEKLLPQNKGVRIGEAEAPVATIDVRRVASNHPIALHWLVRPGQYRPGAVYRVSFRGWTNMATEGQVTVVYHSPSGQEDDQWIEGRRFWMPVWKEYAFLFMAPPDGSIPFSLVFRVGRSGCYHQGIAQITDLTVREIEAPLPDWGFLKPAGLEMLAPDSEVDFRKLAFEQRAAIDRRAAWPTN